MDRGWHHAQFNFRMDDTRIAEIFRGPAPSRSGGPLSVEPPLEGDPVPELPEIPTEFSPGFFADTQNQPWAPLNQGSPAIFMLCFPVNNLPGREARGY